MRIISGDLKGRRLVSPAGRITRPTADRIRESIFNIIGPRLPDLRVLDLFAGTGAMGIEALSRGARTAVFIENDNTALAALHQNIAALNLSGRCRVISLDIENHIEKFLSASVSGMTPYDLVFMDPPYAARHIGSTLFALACSDSLGPGARIVVEHSRQEPIPPVPDGLVLSDQRRFGKTLVSFLDRMV